MRRSTLALTAAVVAATLVSTQVHADPVLLGTATGGMMIHYNNIDNSGAGGVGHPDGVISGYDENPANIAYSNTQFSPSDTNGAGFSFNGALLQSIFGQISPTQFGLDLTYQAATYSNAGGVIAPTLNIKDNVNGNPANSTTTAGGTTAFAIDGYNGANGPGTQSNPVINSLFRGTGVTFNIDSISLSGSIYTLQLSGALVTDGLIHWYTPGTPDSTLSSLGLTNTLNYAGTLSYDAAGDNGSTQTDFYAGNISLFANTVPLPSSALAGSALLAGLALVARRRASV